MSLDIDPAVFGTPDIEPPDDQPDLLAGLRDGAWLDTQVFPPLSYAVPDHPRRIDATGRPTEDRQPWFVLACALAVACGGRALGNVKVDDRPVLYLALEDGDRRLQDRCRTLLGEDAIPKGFEYLTVVTPVLIVPTIEQWMQRYAGLGPLVILDTLGKAAPPSSPGESAYGRDYRIGSRLKRLADEHGATLLINHHDRKAASADFIDSVSGTNGLAGSADTVLVLTRARHETNGLLQVTGRDVREDEYAVQFNAWAIWQLDGETLDDAANKAAEHRAAERLSDRSVEVLAFVNTCPAAVQAEDVAEAVGIDKATANTYLARPLPRARSFVRPVVSIPPLEVLEVLENPTLTTLLMNLQSTDLKHS